MSELERGSFLPKDVAFLEELAASFEKVTVRPRMPGPGYAEKARLETEMFQTRARKLRGIAARIKRILEAKPA